MPRSSAQVGGRPDYPVYTTKAATDVSYLAAADRLLAVAPALYAQFATHNARTLAAVRRRAERVGVGCERQRLHGMGEALHGAASARWADFPLRVYAPVGGHEDLLPYLVRRLLENGANTSFVHALLDEDVPAEVVAGDPLAALTALPGAAPEDPETARYPAARRRSAAGALTSSVAAERARLTAAVAGLGPLAAPHTDATAHGDRPGVPGRARGATGVGRRGRRDARRAAAQGRRRDRGRATAPGRAALARSRQDARGRRWRGARGSRLLPLLRRPRGAGLRRAEAVARRPVGESNALELHGRGVFACISPWNFPLSIFGGQIAAALAAGNGVVAKPAEQTPRIAAEAVKLFHAAGLDPRLLTLAPGDGAGVGQALIAHPSCDGVAFTGGTDTAWAINRARSPRRPHRAVHRRDRRPQRHVRRHHRA